MTDQVQEIKWNPKRKDSARIIKDPVMGWRRRPGVSLETLQDLHRRLVIGPNGYRVIPGQPSKFKKRIWIFGCSCTEGQWLEDENTYAYKLQQRFPDWKIETFGIGAYSNFQNLLQLEANLVNDRPDSVVFTFIPGHPSRNVADPELWLPYMTQNREHWGLGLGKGMQTFRPAARLSNDGRLIYHRVYPPQNREAYDAMMVYQPDQFYKNLITAKIMIKGQQLARSVGADFHYAVLWSLESVSRNGEGSKDHLKHCPIATRLRAAGVNIIDADPRRPFTETTFAPVDGHPNALANEHFAKAIGDALEDSL